MSRNHSTSPSSPNKPAKPYPEFPLFPHATRRWAKKSRGKLHYFGPWSDPDGALTKYLEQKDALRAGCKPREAIESRPKWVPEFTPRRGPRGSSASRLHREVTIPSFPVQAPLPGQITPPLSGGPGGTGPANTILKIVLPGPVPFCPPARACPSAAGTMVGTLARKPSAVSLLRR
jgi:hypothetical protein